MSTKICECGHSLDEHLDFGHPGGLSCTHLEEKPGLMIYCPCLAFVWESGDEESDPTSQKFVDWGTA